MILARLLGPDDFGLVGWSRPSPACSACSGISACPPPPIQRAEVTHEQASTLFWINMLVGGLLGLLTLGLSPAVAAFYREPRLVAVTAALAAGFCSTRPASSTASFFNARCALRRWRSSTRSPPSSGAPLASAGPWLDTDTGLSWR